VEGVLLLERAQPAHRNAERADRVPHADEADIDPVVAVEAIARTELRRSGIVRLLIVVIELERLVVVRGVLRREDAALADHAHHAARRERAAAEAEHEELVAELVVADEEAVGVVNVFLHALADRAAGDPVDGVAGADALVVVGDLRDAGEIMLGYPVGKAHDVRRTRPAVVIGLVRGVPGAVAANDESFHAGITPRNGDSCLSVSPEFQKQPGTQRFTRRVYVT